MNNVLLLLLLLIAVVLMVEMVVVAAVVAVLAMAVVVVAIGGSTDNDGVVVVAVHLFVLDHDKGNIHFFHLFIYLFRIVTVFLPFCSLTKRVTSKICCFVWFN